jgi:hypothetical protein
VQNRHIASTPAHPARSTTRTGARRPPRRIALILLAVTVVMLVLRSPLSVVTLIGTPSMLGPTAPHDGPVDTVPDVVDARAGDGGDRAAGHGGPLGGDVSDGRWGASPVRPGGLDIVVEEFRGGWRVEGGAEEAAAIAVIAAHAWADTRVERSSGSTTTSGTGVVVAVEAVERPGALHAVVTLLVTSDEDLHRIAVPIRFGADGPSVAGTPWSLPAPTGAVSEVRGVAVSDPELLEAARRALEAVGVPGARLVGLEATDGWPFIARLDDDADGSPWLRWHLDRFVVSGIPLHTGGGPR